MVLGFDDPKEFDPVIGWELYQVTFDKYHVMFLFENGLQLLNVAHSFSHCSADGHTNYVYELHGPRKTNEIARLLRQRVTDVEIFFRDQLTLRFDNGDELTIHDSPNLCSWWFMPLHDAKFPNKAPTWSKSDEAF